jgi:nucleoside-diphosphate-sugar epimerase
MEKMLIVGCGDIGCRIAQAASLQCDQILGIVRSNTSSDKLHSLGIRCLQTDLDKPKEHPAETIHINGMDIFYLAPPPARGDEDTRLLNFFARATGKPGRFVYLSTTGLYGDCHGAWIDETCTVHPTADRAKRRWHAEQLVTRIANERGFEYLIMRVPGIYGKNRLPLAKIKAAQPVLESSVAPYTNRIHEDDLATAALALLDKGKSGEIYNITDGHPGTMTDYFNTIADFSGLPHPPQISMQEAQEQLSAGMLSYLSESRRLSNNKLLRTTGLQLRYPTLNDGLSAIFNPAS